MKDRRGRQKLTYVEFYLALALLFPLGLILFDAVPKFIGDRARLSCQDNLRQIGQALQMYVSESEGMRYPLPKLRDCNGEIQPWSGAMDLAEVHPEYLIDLDHFVCPAYGPGENAVEIWDEGKTTNPRWSAVKGFSNNGTVEPCEVLAQPYYYYGWALENNAFMPVSHFERLDPEDERESHVKGGGVQVTVHYTETHNTRFRTAVKSFATNVRANGAEAFANNWEMTYASGTPLQLPMGSFIPFLRDGAERFYIRDIGNPAAGPAERARIIVLHEEAFRKRKDAYHSDGGINVLYMDGHVDWQPMPVNRWSPKFPFNTPGQILHDAVAGQLDDL